MSKTDPSIYNYIDYRKFLRDYCEKQKEIHPHFSYRYFARVADLGSFGYLKMVIDGTRNLSVKTLNKFIKALKLGKKEAAFFEAMVNFNQSQSDKERDLYFERMVSLREAVKITGLTKDQYEYYRYRYFVIIREMVALEEFVEDPAWIAARVNPAIRQHEAAHAVGALLRMGLLKRNADGKLEQADVSIASPAEMESLALFNFQRDMLNQAKDAMVKIDASLRDITSLTIPLPLTMVDEIKKKITVFREQIIDYVNKSAKSFDEVYQLNLQLFPVTQKKVNEPDENQ